MKTTILIRKGLIMMAVASLSLFGCKKEFNSNNEKPKSSSLEKVNSDNDKVSYAETAVMNDVNGIVSSNGGKSTLMLPCNVTLDTNTIVDDTIIYHVMYHGLNCEGTLNIQGDVYVKKYLYDAWATAGTKVFVYYPNLYITSVYDGISFTLSGSEVCENVSGGILFYLGYSLSSISHKISGSSLVTFDDGSSTSWNTMYMRTFSGAIDDFVLTIEGLGSADGYNNLINWGLTRENDNFYTEINVPVTFKQVCGWKGNEGSEIIYLPAEDLKATISLGYDSNNQPVNPGDCADRYRVDWEQSGQTGTFYGVL